MYSSFAGVELLSWQGSNTRKIEDFLALSSKTSNRYAIWLGIWLSGDDIVWSATRGLARAVGSQITLITSHQGSSLLFPNANKTLDIKLGAVGPGASKLVFQFCAGEI